MFEEKYEDAISSIDDIIVKNSVNIDLLMMKSDICYQADRMFESEEIFLQILKLKPNQNNNFWVYLRLGETYLNRKSWDDARIIF